MINSLNLLNPHKFLSVSIGLAIEACQAIKDSHSTKNIKHYSKGIDNPVTEIDFKIQSILTKGYKKFFPKLKIIGEEQKQYQGTLNIDYQSMESQQITNRINFTKEYEMEKCCLWVDPIDNTRGFIEGQIEAVTTLIGLSYQGKAQLGIIALPFKRNKQRVYYHPSVLFGSVSEKIAYQYYPKENRWISLYAQKHNTSLFLTHRKKIVMSSFRQNLVQKKIAQKLNCDILQAGGSGYKMAMVAKKQADIMAYCLSHTQKWDTCAGEAVIKALQGNCTNRFGEQILYDGNNPQQYNKDGVICSLNKQLLNKSVEICKDNNGQ